MKQALHLPNITWATKVTILRILGVPVFILLLLYYTISLRNGEANEMYRHWAFAVFLLVAITDALDGYLARSRNEITRLGTILDPIADKLLLLSGVILLTRPSLPALDPQLPVIFTLVVISRDVISVAGAFVVHQMTGRVDIRPRWTGKVATCFQMLAIAQVLGRFGEGFFLTVVWTAGIFTLLSGAQYLLDGVRQFEKEHP